MPGEWLSRIRLRLTGLLLRRRLDRDLDEELRFHLEMREARLRADGAAPAEARSAARRSFGNPTKIKEATRDLWTFATPEAIWQDLRYAARRLVQNPGFAAVAILTLALGIGANTAMFAVTDAVLLRPLPYPAPSRLMFLRERIAGEGWLSFSIPDFKDLAAQNHTFEAMAVYESRHFVLTGKGDPTLLRCAVVSAPFFPLLGAKTAFGRVFTDQDDRAGAVPVAVLTYGFWQGRLGGNPAVLGKTLALSGQPYMVVGVLAPDFATSGIIGGIDAYLPIGLSAGMPAWTNRGSHGSLSGIGRLRAGVTMAAAQVDLDGIMERVARQYPATNRGHLAFLEPLSRYVSGDDAPPLWLLLGAVGLVLLIACANLASLELARSTTRLREFAIRSAIGAGRVRVFRQLLSESLLMALAGGAAGLCVAAASIGPLLRLAPQAIPGLGGSGIPRLMTAGMNGPALAFNFLVAVLAGALFGTAPALQSARIGPAAALQQTNRSTAARSGERLRRSFLVVEIALALLLVTGSGLMLRSLDRAENADPGFSPRNLIALDVVMTGSRYSASQAGQAASVKLQFVATALARLRSLPAVDSAGATLCPPLVGDCWDYFYSIPGKPSPVGGAADAEFNLVDPGYFSTLRAPLLAGRRFMDSDTAASEPVTIINQAMARRWWPHASPLGQSLRYGEPRGAGKIYRIVGVVSDVRQDGMDQPQMEEAFFPLAQNPPSAIVFIARARGNLDALIPAATAAIHAADPALPVRVHPMTAYVAASLAHRRFLTILLGLFGVLALGLASLGVYGVISFAVAQRTPEIGVRMAIGAAPSDVLRLVLRSGARLALLGIGIGLVASLALTRLLRTLLYGVTATDPLTYAAAVSIIFVVALAACYIPARRALRVDPNVALRYE